VLGGRSAGARSAARTARHLGASGYLGLSFPLHPPGRPEKSRVEELLGVEVPRLVVQGERDALGLPDEFPGHVQMTVVPEADHGLKVPARAAVTQEEALLVVTEATLEFVVREVAGNPDRP
jgi:predicted alpha/beta-hydrolase family hydrolase